MKKLSACAVLRISGVTNSPIGDTGDSDCPGEDIDAEGFILQPTPESIAASDAAIDDWADHERAVEALMETIDPKCWDDAGRATAAREKAEEQLAI